MYAYKGNYQCEVIIIDDGSTDTPTLSLLENFEQQNITVLHQDNKGPAAARNTGVRYSNSEYILFLDSDNRIYPAYIDKGIKELEQNKQAAVVYAKPDFFGEKNESSFQTGSFDITRLLLANYIDMCTIIRKAAWVEVKGIDENLVQYEDWEFWINIYKAGWEFVFIDEPLFEYRIRKDSLISQMPEENFKKALAYIYKKHWDLLYTVYHQLYAAKLMYENDMQRPLRSFLKYSKKLLQRKTTTQDHKS